jgi:molecular chaperone GrpE
MAENDFERPPDSPEALRDLRAKAAKADEYLELARRTKADFSNYQDRIRRERGEWGKEAVLEFVRDFLPALDSFTWARFEEPTLMESLHLVEREFLKNLAHHHILPIATAGRMFDPAFHEAVAVEETADRPPGTILEQVRRGWMMGDRVIRPAGVRVAKAPSERQDPARSGATEET